MMMSCTPHRWCNLTAFILLALLLGLLVGSLVHAFVRDASALSSLSSFFSLLSNLFLTLIKMVISPLVFSLLSSAIARADGGPSALGRTGLTTLAWFLLASLCSLLLGLLLVNLLSPGVALQPLAQSLLLNASSLPTDVQNPQDAISLASVLSHAIPTSIFDALARNQLLQILVFSVFFGAAAAAVGPQAHPLVAFLEAVSLVMLQLTQFVMRFAPIGVFGAVASTVSANGLLALGPLLVFVLEFYLGIACLWGLLIFAGFCCVRGRIVSLLRRLREPFLLAFTTASSEAAYPKTLVGLTAFGVHPRVASLVLPLGYSFNLDGSMMYCTFAVVFIAQAFSVELSASQQVTMLLILMLTSKGMAGVPRASLLVIQATLAHFNIPEVGLLLILGVDHFLDVCLYYFFLYNYFLKI